MKSFMSAALQETTTKPNSASTECGGCNTAVRTSGQESVETPVAEPVAKEGEPVVVMQGPLGSVITEALNKSLSKKAITNPVNVPTAAIEAYAGVQANGQIVPSNTVVNSINSISKAVGLVPVVNDEPTVVNTMLDAISKVDDVQFITVEVVESEVSTPRVPQKSLLEIAGANTGVESIAIESVSMVVTYRKVSK